MNIKNNTILVTGGSSGIGLQMSKVLIKKGNTVIICGKSNDKLLAAKKSEPKLVAYQCDLSNSDACVDLANWITKNHPELNVVINNAAVVNKIDFLENEKAMEIAESEFQTNLFGPLRLIKLLYNTIRKNDSPTIINVTTGLIYAPRKIYPFYNSTKAALHTFTQTLRLSLKNEKTKVIEVMFPAVDTPWHNGSAPKIAISPEEAVSEMIKGLESGKEEIRVKGAKVLYLLSRIAPKFALKKINQIV